MMVTVKQRFPNSSTNFKPEQVKCSSVEEVMSVPFVKRWMQANNNFYRFCKTTCKTAPHYLICETNRGEQYWAIAFLEGDVEQLSLPEWRK